ncbi:MAG TPA: hypothetical protein VER12_17895 [Polyangiaceae bacterium]|jgi:hypothetical protein|nr:hypothetical protein [Polyangiaceae bacterium]
MAALRKLARAVIGCTLLGASGLGCQRNAPGPEECARFAEAVVGAHRYITPAIAAQIETQTRECLTRPYDRELLECVLLTRYASRCLAAFRARHANVIDDLDSEQPE